MKSGVSQREVSRRSGLPPETICCFVHGRRGLAIESFDKLVAALGLHLTEPEGRCEAMMHEARKTRSTWEPGCWSGSRAIGHLACAVSDAMPRTGGTEEWSGAWQVLCLMQVSLTR